MFIPVQFKNIPVCHPVHKSSWTYFWKSWTYFWNGSDSFVVKHGWEIPELNACLCRFWETPRTLPGNFPADGQPSLPIGERPLATARRAPRFLFHVHEPAAVGAWRCHGWRGFVTWVVGCHEKRYRYSIGTASDEIMIFCLEYLCVCVCVYIYTLIFKGQV